MIDTTACQPTIFEIDISKEKIYAQKRGARGETKGQKNE